MSSPRYIAVFSSANTGQIELDRIYSNLLDASTGQKTRNHSGQPRAFHIIGRDDNLEFFSYSNRGEVIITVFTDSQSQRYIAMHSANNRCLSNLLKAIQAR